MDVGEVQTGTDKNTHIRGLIESRGYCYLCQFSTIKSLNNE
jgi:hypothetical protein